MKLLTLLIFNVVATVFCEGPCAQKYRSNRYSRLNNDNYLSVSLYKTPLPYSYGGKVGYGHNVSENTYSNGEVVAEKGTPHELDYSFIGADIGISYAPFDLGRSLYLYLKGGATGGYNAINEMKGRGFSVGGKGGLEPNAYVRDGLAVGAFFSQGVSHSVTSTTSEGCQNISEQTSIKVHPLPRPTIATTGSTAFCQGDSVVLRIREEAGSYRWSNGATTRSITVKESGEYTASIKNPQGCERASDPTRITVRPNPKPSISHSDPTVCDGDSVRLEASPGFSFLWSNGGMARSIFAKDPGRYNVTVTNSHGCANTSESVPVNVLRNDVPAVFSSNGREFCAGESTVLTASEGKLYRWNTGETTRSITVAKSDSYQVSVINANDYQRIGRGRRTGNRVAEKHGGVHNLYYVVENSPEVAKVDLLRRKAAFISQMKTGDVSVRRIDEGAVDESTGISYADIVMQTSGDGRYKERNRLENLVGKMEVERASFQAIAASNGRRKEVLERSIPHHRANIESLSKDLADYAPNVKHIQNGANKGEIVNETKITGQKFANEEMLGKHLIALSKSQMKDESKEIGSLYGFAITMERNSVYTDDHRREACNTFQVRKNGRPITFGGGIISGENPKRAARHFYYALNRLDALIERERNALRQAEKEHEKVSRNTDVRYPKEKELAGLKAQLAQLTGEMKKELGGKRGDTAERPRKGKGVRV